MGTNDVFFSQHPVQNLLARLDNLSPIHILSRESGPSGTILSSTSASTGDSDVWIFGLHYLMMWTRHPRGLCLSERDRQRPDNRSMTCATNAQVASHGTNSTRYTLTPSFFTTDPFIIAETPDIYAIGCQPRLATLLVKDGKLRLTEDMLVRSR